MSACWVSCLRSTYFWRNINIPSVFYSSKSASIYSQYCIPLDTLKMMLFIKSLIKWKCIGTFGLKFQYWCNSKSSIEQNIKRLMLYLFNASWIFRSHKYVSNNICMYSVEREMDMWNMWTSTGVSLLFWLKEVGSTLKLCSLLFDCYKVGMTPVLAHIFHICITLDGISHHSKWIKQWYKAGIPYSCNMHY